MNLHILFLLLIFGSTSSQAGGYHCSSECVVMDSDQFKIHYLDPVEISAGFKRERVFKMLQGICKDQSSALGLGTRGILVNGIWWRSEKDVSTEKSSYDSYGDDFGMSTTAPNRPYSRKFSYSTNFGFQVAKGRTHNQKDIHGWEVHPDGASSAKNCDYQKTISEFDVPYQGTDELKGE